ncbi:MAG TPA: HEAT repeat domain-containing protein, partial [Polyangiaceae bacterium]|nr:HEAT repeat domain-containing protein [Polyangiaceae bacterium]
KADDRFERLAALDGLNQLGATLPWSQIEPMLVDPILARPALLAAGRSGDPRAAEPLIKALTTARGATFEAALVGLHDSVRAGEASEAAAKRAFQAAGAPLEATLIRTASTQSDQLTSRRIATFLLGCIESANAASVVVALLADDSVTAEAEEALLLMGPACVDAVVLGLEQADPEQRARGVELLARMFAEEPSPVVVQAVAARVDDDDPHVVRVALEALAQLGDASTLQLVANKLVRARGAVRWSAETALAEIALRFPEPAQRLIEQATPQGKDAVAAAVVLGALARVFPLSQRDEEFLTDVLAHESMFARRAALDALATGKTPRAIDAVAFALTDEHREVQMAAIRTLGRMRDESGHSPGLGHLLPLVAEAPDQELLAHAVAALGDTGSIEAVRALRQLTRTAPAPVAVSAIEAIVRIPEIRHVDDLIDGLSHPSPEVVKAALGAISELNDPRVATHIGVCLDHEAWDVRRLAADLLGELGGESNVNLLRAKLQLEKEPLVRDALARALESLGALRRTPSPAGGSIVPR